jgi:4-amino-4-deoxy-L-arabinose transferase-like glycosyltransferase
MSFPSSALGPDTQKLYRLYLCLLCVMLYISALGARDFWAPVEPRYAEIARVMFSKNEWIVPTINGDLYTDKPILYFWLALIGAKIFGAVNEWTVRLPAALGGVGFVFATYLLGRDFFNARTGFIAAAILATSMRVVWEARWAHVDMVFCAFFLFAVYFGARSLFHKGQPHEIFFTYLFLALATLTKGLIGVVLPGLLFLAVMLVRREWRMISQLKLQLGLPLFSLIAAPWFYLVTRATDGKWLADFIYIHHIQRYTAGAGHRQPFYYYLTTLPADFLPWTIFLIPALFAFRPYRRRWADPVVQFFVLWFFSVFLFFTFSDTKRDLYLLPLMPTLALFVGRYFDDLATGKIALSAAYQGLAIAFFGLVAIAGFAVPCAAWFVRRDAFAAVLPTSLVLLLGGSGTVLFLWRRRSLQAAASIAAMMALTVLCAAIWLMPYLENFKSPRLFSQQVNQIVPARVPIYVYADTMNDFNFYTARDVIPILSTPLALDALLARGQGGYLLMKERDLQRLQKLPREWITTSEAKSGTAWHLVEIRAPTLEHK